MLSSSKTYGLGDVKRYKTDDRKDLWQSMSPKGEIKNV